MSVGDFSLPVPAFDGTASCVEVDPELFFPDQGGSARGAKEVCRRCEIREPCLLWALDNDETTGIWGGLTAVERRPLARARRRKAA